MIFQLNRAIILLSLLFLIGCNKKELQFEDPLVTNRDTTVNPGDDFFYYANGGWFKNILYPVQRVVMVFLELLETLLMHKLSVFANNRQKIARQ